MTPTGAHVTCVSIMYHYVSHTQYCVLALLNSLPIIHPSLLVQDTYSQLNINCTPHVVTIREHNDWLNLFLALKILHLINARTV